MTSQRLSAFVVALAMLLAVVAGLWLSKHLASVFGPPAPTAIPSPTVTPVPPSPSPTMPPVPRGFRLAGVAVNVEQMYAVIEFPDGHHALFRSNDEVEGLGRLTHIGAEHVIVSTSTGDLTLVVAPAATLTPTPRHPGGTTTPKRSPSPARVGGGTAPVSTPSVVRDQPAS
ncbi:MAG: hypothetical protein HY270_00320 [Deltaproteobacteria bacterium]|nr:hypothetical protein [Deltaproteobacteria bacterium]